MIEARRARRRRLLFGVLGAWAVLAVVFGGLDLAISQALVDRRSSLAAFVEHYGEIPGYLVILAALLVVDATWRRPAGALGVALSGASLVASTFLAYIVGALVWYRLSPATAQRYSAPVLLMAFALAGVAARTPLGSPWVSRVGPTAVRWARTTVALALLNFLVFVQTAKALWGRVRYRDLDPAFSNFTPWFLPQGPGGRGESFPSGHAALGWMFLPLMLVALERGENRRVGVAVAVAAIAWGVVVAVGRVVAGAHYASDVLFSTGVAWTCALMLHRAAAGAADRRDQG